MKKRCDNCKENYTGYSKTVNCLTCNDKYNHHIPFYEDDDESNE